MFRKAYPLCLCVVSLAQCVKNIKDVGKTLREIQVVEIIGRTLVNGTVDKSKVVRAPAPCPEAAYATYYIRNPRDLEGHHSHIYTADTPVKVIEKKVFNCEKQDKKSFSLPVDYKTLLNTFSRIIQDDLQAAKFSRVRFVGSGELFKNPDYKAARERISGKETFLGVTHDLRQPVAEYPQGNTRGVKPTGRKIFSNWPDGYDVFWPTTAGSEYLQSKPEVGALYYTLQISFFDIGGTEVLDSYGEKRVIDPFEISVVKNVHLQSDKNIRVNFVVSAQMGNQRERFLLKKGLSGPNEGIVQKQFIMCDIETAKCDRPIVDVVKDLTHAANKEVITVIQLEADGAAP